MVKVLCLVEGYTEEKFVNTCLFPHMEGHGIFLKAIIVNTKRVAGEKAFKGGYTRYPVLRKQIESLLGDTSAVAVTTMFDYYGLPREFPGFIVSTDDPYQRVLNAELAWAADLHNHSKFIPHLQLHEFEALLFSNADVISKQMRAICGSGLGTSLYRQATRAANPEEINNDPDSHPSKRIEMEFAEQDGRKYNTIYNKETHGILIAQAIGLAVILDKCRHFRDWVNKLESLSRN